MITTKDVTSLSLEVSRLVSWRNIVPETGGDKQKLWHHPSLMNVTL
jgi:hypothetical protein